MVKMGENKKTKNRQGRTDRKIRVERKDEERRN